MLLITYQYCEKAGTFIPLADMPTDLQLQVTCATQAILAINQGANNRLECF